MRKLVLTQRTYRCKDCNPLSNVPVEEDKTYYKFFNEWGNRTVAWYEEGQYIIERDSYNGVVTLKRKDNI